MNYENDDEIHPPLLPGEAVFAFFPASEDEVAAIVITSRASLEDDGDLDEDIIVAQFAVLNQPGAPFRFDNEAYGTWWVHTTDNTPVVGAALIAYLTGLGFVYDQSLEDYQ